MKKKRIFRGFVFAMALILVPYAVYQVYMAIHPIYRTQVALVESVQDTIPAKGIVVRDEVVMEGFDSAGVYNYLVGNGDKVGNGSEIAEIYGSASDALNHLAILQYESELAILSNTEGQGRTAGTNIDSLTMRIERETTDLAVRISQNEYGTIESSRLHLLELLHSYGVSSGESADNAERRIFLEQQISMLSANALDPIGYVTSPQEGYFMSFLDGMETVVRSQDVLDMSVNEIASLVEMEGTQENLPGCKIVSDYKWQYAALIDAEYAVRFQPGMEVDLNLHASSLQSVPVEVVSVKVDETDSRAVVIVSCDIFNEEITGLRFEETSFGFHNYRGFLIDRSWLHMVDNVPGVYVKQGTRVEFRRVDIVFETEAYILSRADASEYGILAMYDEILIEGRTLQVGMELK